MFRIHPRQNGFDLSITGHFLEVHVSEDDETCLYCRCDITRGQGVNTTHLQGQDEWTHECRKASNTLKQSLCVQPILKYADTSKGVTHCTQMQVSTDGQEF